MGVVRLFVAVYPPVSVAERLLAAIEMLVLPKHKPTVVEQVHLTLRCIGETDVRQLDEVRESVARSVAGIGAFELTPMRLISLPERGPARLIACEMDLPAALAEIHRRLAHRLARNTRERAGERFLPHATLCRFGSPTAGVRVEAPVEVGSFEIDQVRLMRSVLRPGGALHVAEAVFGLEKLDEFDA
ncbi:MAG: RNA 2',3'-cyclic phosphodiesterase [Phycisphaerales bacterium]|nr:RNA 2',3'-cyclic phosphodiesterase [Phycisphaerales bacterium]